MGPILVTGAEGFVGRHLVAHLARVFPQATLATPKFDIRDPAAVHAAVMQSAPEACIHLAAISAVPAAQADIDAAWQVNLHGTLHLARAILRQAPECTLIFASTADAYGSSFRGGVPVTEATPLAPLNTYSATKAAADLALGAMVADGLRVIRVRAFNHTGPGQSSAFVVAAFARQVARIAAGLQDPVIQVGNLDAFRDFLDVRDVCRAYATCAAKAADMQAGQLLNIASGVTRRVGDILSELSDLAGVNPAIEVNPARLRAADIPVAVGDFSIAKKLLGWSPEIQWRTTLEDTLRDWQGRVRSEV
jgi:GDP-4-dehydro-6-deoxy-D-mannose reductase